MAGRKTLDEAVRLGGACEDLAGSRVEGDGFGALGAAIDAEGDHIVGFTDLGFRFSRCGLDNVKPNESAPPLSQNENQKSRTEILFAMVKKLLHTRYRVSDLEKTISFYKDVLGLEETRRHTSPRGSQLVFLKAPGSEEEIEICKFDESGPVQVGQDITHLAFEVDDIEAFAKSSAAKGYPFRTAPRRQVPGASLLLLTRPRGTKSS